MDLWESFVDISETTYKLPDNCKTPNQKKLGPYTFVVVVVVVYLAT